MTYSFTEKKRIRKTFGKQAGGDLVPNLLDIQRESYRKLLQKDVPTQQRIDQGLQAAFKSVFPIESYNGLASLDFVSYRLGEPIYDARECKRQSRIFSAPLHAVLRLIVFEKVAGGEKVIHDVKEQDVYMGEVPLMTKDGTFIINGTQRVIVSQLHRSPGVFFDHDKGKTHASGKLLFSARVIPYRGSWLDFEFDQKDLMYVRIDRRRKLPATVILRALNYSTEEILGLFFDTETVRLVAEGVVIDFVPERLRGQDFEFDITTPSGEVIVEAGKRVTARHVRALTSSRVKRLPVSDSYLARNPGMGLSKVLAKAVVDTNTGELLADANDQLTTELLANFRVAGVDEIEIIYANDIDHGPFVSDTLRADDTRSALEAQIEIYRMMRPGEPPTKDSAEQLFKNLFFNTERYDLSMVGRMKLNRRLGRPSDEGPSHLTQEDIIDVLRVIVSLKNGRG